MQKIKHGPAASTRNFSLSTTKILSGENQAAIAPVKKPEIAAVLDSQAVKGLKIILKSLIDSNHLEESPEVIAIKQAIQDNTK